MHPRFTLLLLAAVPGFAVDLPSFFLPNAGQLNQGIRYFMQTPGLSAGFSAEAATFQMHGQMVRVRFVGADPRVEVEGMDPLAARASFFVGDQPGDWRTDQPVYGKIRYRNLYPGIDMSYGEAGRRIKSEFLIAPGADPSVIRLEYSSAIAIDPGGDLLVHGEHIEMREDAPFVYQESAAGQVQIPSRYKVLDGNTVGFEIGAYDPALPLVIDPVLSYATYLGGSGLGAVTALAVDSSGASYVTGWTEAPDFPSLQPIQASNAGGVDVFIAKLNPAGNALVYATYIGGHGDDRAAGIAVDASGKAYVTGSTNSLDFPLRSAIRPTLGGGRDAFALQLNAAGNALLYSTYLGGTNSDWGTAIALDASGNAYIAGDTLSADFPVLGAVQPALGGSTDAFVTKLTSAGAIAFSTFLGGGADEHAGGIAVDWSGNAYVAGGTMSTNFPVVESIQALNGGAQDAFLSKLTANGSAIVYSTYLGGSGGAVGTPEQANAVAVDASGNAYLTGVTNSPNFPVTAGAFQTQFDGVQDVFVAKVNPAGNALIYSSYLGGTSFDWGSGLAIDRRGNAYVAGYTSSWDFPTVGPVQSGFNGFYDALVFKLNASGNVLGFSSYFGGTSSDLANAIAVDSQGDIFVGGQTNSLDLPVQSAIQSSNTSSENGGSTGWVARIGVTIPPPQIPSAVLVSPPSGAGSSVTLTAHFSDPGGVIALTSATLLLNTTASSGDGCQVTYTPSTNQFTVADGDSCNLTASSVAISGNTLAVTVSLAFQPGFQGPKTIYLYAADANSNTGWMACGTWAVTVPPPQPTASSVTPNRSAGSGQTFTFVFSDTQDPANITGMVMLFGSAVIPANACFLFVDGRAGTISLFSDDGMESGAGTKSIASSTVLQNSQCAVGTTSLVLSGLSSIVSAAIRFKGAFGGVKNIYLYGADNDGITSGWQMLGTYTVTTGTVP